MLNEQSGVPSNVSLLQLDITYGNLVGYTPDVAGPFTFSGATAPNTQQIYQTGIGQYAFDWSVPLDIPGGVYTANWTFVFQSDTDIETENFPVAEGSGQSGGITPPIGDVGYWTGGLLYPAAGIDLEFGETDDNGVTWLLHKVTGWDGPPVQGGGVIPRSGDHGGWASPQYFAPRLPILTCTAMAPTQWHRDAARALLSHAVPVSDLAVFRYDEPISKVAQVRRTDRITETYPDLASVQFTVPLIAPDPRKYATQGKTVTFAPGAGGVTTGITLPVILPFTLPPKQPSGSIAVINAGNFETRPLFVITGPITSPVVSNVTTSQSVSWTGLQVLAGQQFTVDFLAQQGTLNGSFRPADPFSSWWNLPPGTSTIAVSGSGDTGGTVTCSFSDAWV